MESISSGCKPWGIEAVPLILKVSYNKTQKSNLDCCYSCGLELAVTVAPPPEAVALAGETLI